MKLIFYGGAKSVTGSNYLLEEGNIKILVDCGLFQGSKYAEDLNYEKFKYNPAEINYVFLTHSHTDHSGRLPKLYKEGFRGQFISTKATLDMVAVALPDNLKLMNEEAERGGHAPLFNQKDLDGIISLAHGVNYEEEIDLGKGIKVKLHDAGHILGSAIIRFNFEDKKIYFSGDLGNPPTPLLNTPYMPENPDYLVVESAYGNRVHEDRGKRRDLLRDIIKETVQKGGALIIPSFAIERTQEILFEMNELFKYKEIPEVPIFVDSPLAINLTKVYKKYSEYFNKNANYIIKSGDDIFDFPGLNFTITTQESKSINDVKGSKIIIAGSGMSNGGRILHHEQRYLSDPSSTILFVGYQVEGSLGRQILDGVTNVRIFGESVPVRCAVKAIGGYSAHADQAELLKWVSYGAKGGNLKKIFVVQGESDSAQSLADKIKRELGIEAIAPDLEEEMEL